MAFIQMNIMSSALRRTVNVNAIIPIDKVSMPGDKTPVTGERKELKTLYLLHGFYGSQFDWTNGTKLQRWADDRNLAVIMPSGENSFYIDSEKTGSKFGTFVGEELVDLTRNMFPLSRAKEDTFIAGLSMGGFGALRNGLKYYDTFGYIAGLSSGNPINEIDYGTGALSRENFENLFGDPEDVRNGDNSIEYLIRENVKNGKTDQKFFLACGTEDHLFAESAKLNDALSKAGYDVKFETGPGGHEWDFWNEYILHVLNWLPLDGVSQGLSSGHVR